MAQVAELICEADWTLILQFTKVVFSWPPVVLIIVITSLFFFKTSLEGLISRIVGFKTKWAEVYAPIVPQNSDKSEDALKNEAANPAPPAHSDADSTDKYSGLSKEYINNIDARATVDFIEANPAKTYMIHSELFKNFNNERIFNQIYGTQISLLSHLIVRSENVATTPENDLRSFYKEHLNKQPLKVVPFEEYLQYLIDTNLIFKEFSNGVPFYGVTKTAKDFLSYILANYPLGYLTKQL